jgi:ribonuclease H2 subunit A
MEYEAGIDEAGRGPVIGPMVYAIAAWPVAKRAELAAIGFTDSKKLTEDDRDRFFALIKNNPDIIYETKIISSRDISNGMLARDAKVSLNAMSHNAAFELIANLMYKRKLTLSAVYVDTVGVPDHYRQRLEANFPGATKFVVESKADLTYPVVSAASICAKVTRDAAVTDIQNQIGDVGCGYPSDPATKQWLKDNVDPVFGFDTNYVRMSWKTVDVLTKEQFVWKEEETNKENDIMFQATNLGKFYATKYMSVNLNPQI